MSLTTIVSREDDSWIGLYNIQLKELFQPLSIDPLPIAHYWLDGSTSTFRRWAAGEPNDNTYCIVMNEDGEFEDEPNCDVKFGFVCKRSAG